MWSLALENSDCIFPLSLSEIEFLQIAWKDSWKREIKGKKVIIMMQERQDDIVTLALFSVVLYLVWNKN